MQSVRMVKLMSTFGFLRLLTALTPTSVSPARRRLATSRSVVYCTVHLRRYLRYGCFTCGLAAVRLRQQHFVETLLSEPIALFSVLEKVFANDTRLQVDKMHLPHEQH